MILRWPDRPLRAVRMREICRTLLAVPVGGCGGQQDPVDVVTRVLRRIASSSSYRTALLPALVTAGRRRDPDRR
jgi:hypothetical protein